MPRRGVRLLAILAVLTAAAPGVRADDLVRSEDGSFNNQTNFYWGAAGWTFNRLAPIGYDDGLSASRGSLHGSLPNPRLVSNTIVKQTVMAPNAHQMTDWVFQWGQFVDHDLDLTGTAVPAEAFNIPIPKGDAQFDKQSTGTQVMPFLRSTYRLTPPDPTLPREQINDVTSFLDGSQVYGSDLARALALRTLDEGKLKTSAGNLLPFNVDLYDNGTGGPLPPSLAKQFYLAGDVRANEQVGLTAVHTLLLREHNRLADLVAPQFANMSDPVARDEAIYQRVRKLVGGEIESITYNGFLPALLGDYAPSVVGAYDPAVDSSVTTEFSTALFRVGHTMLSPNLLRIQNDGSPAPGGPLSLRDSFFKMANLSGPHELEYMVKGLASDQQQEVDVHMVDDVRDFLFGEPIPGGFDLASLNIQRGRDHGLSGYNDVREAYGLARKATFADITSDPQIQAGLASLYASPDVVDAWVGALAEDHLAASTLGGVGAAVGELIAAGLVDQFTRTRDGDRFWFLNDPSLSPDDKSWIMSRTLADVIRDNTTITNLQANVFFMPAAVPEPTATMLAALGLSLIAARGRRVRTAA